MNELLTSAILKALALQQNLKDIEVRDFPCDSGRVFSRLLSDLAGTLLDRLLDLASQVNDAPTAVEESEVVILARTLAQLARFVEPVALASTEHVPWGLTYPLELVCRRMSPESRVILYPRFDYNYGYFEAIGPLRRIMAGLSEGVGQSLFTGYPRHFAIVFFPAIERLNALQHIVWGHEIGHHLDAVFGTSQKVLTTDILNAEDVDRALSELQKEKDERILGRSPKEQRAYVVEKAIELTRNWVAELTADLYSIHVFGPASLFALCDIALVLFSLDDAGATHPPSRMRLRAMTDELDRLGYRTLLAEPSAIERDRQVKQAVADEVDRLRTLASGQIKKFKHPLHRPAARAARDAIPLIRQAVINDMVGWDKWACSADMLRNDVFKLIECLDYKAPPCEIAEVGLERPRETSLAAIFNAGWFLSHLEKAEAASAE